MDVDNFWFGKNHWTCNELKEYFPDEFIKSFMLYAANFYLSDSTIMDLIRFAKMKYNMGLFKPISDFSHYSIFNAVYSKDLLLFLEWANSQTFKDVYNAYISKQNSTAEETADVKPEEFVKTESEKPAMKEKKQTARQRRYQCMKRQG